MKIAFKLLMISGALFLSTLPFTLQAQESYEVDDYAQEDVVSKPSTSVPTRLEALGKDMVELKPDARLTELRTIAKTALANGRPIIFRDIVVAFFDPNWADLDRGQTALALIGWLPDTAEFLRPRIHATSIAIEEDKLDVQEQAMLWRDLRARVERVGDASLTDDLLIAMTRGGASAQITQTISRLFDTEIERLDTLISLLHDHGQNASDPVRDALLREIDGLTKDRLAQRYDPNRLAIALFRTGHIERANKLVSQEQDPVLRMRTRLTFLLDDPDYGHMADMPATSSDNDIYRQFGPQ